MGIYKSLAMIIIKRGDRLDINEYNEQMKIYETDIDLYIDEYISNLSDQSLIYKPMIFNGLLHFIYDHAFSSNKYGFNNANSNIDYSNTYLINKLIDKYVMLSFQYNHVPTLLGFSLMTGISNATLSSWLSEEYRNKDNSAVCIGELGKPLTHCQTVKRLKDISELALVSNTAETSSIGSLFLLKSNYGYNDQPTPAIEQKPDTDIVDISSITEKYRNSPVPKFEPIE